MTQQENNTSRLYLEDVLRADYDDQYIRSKRAELFDLMGEVKSARAPVPSMAFWEDEDIEDTARVYRRCLWRVTRKLGLHASPVFDFGYTRDTPIEEIFMPWQISWIRIFSKAFLDGEWDHEDQIPQNWGNAFHTLGKNEGLMFFLCARSIEDSSFITRDEDLGAWVFDPESTEEFHELWELGTDFDHE